MTREVEAEAGATMVGTTVPDAAEVVACCSSLYGHPLAELIMGESFHPGGLTGTRELLRTSGLNPGQRILDAGCGLGASARLAADEFGLTVDAVDISADVVSRASDRGTTTRIRWRTADLMDLPFEAATYDAVLAECVLSTTVRGAVINELKRVLRPGGIMLISDVQASGSAVPALVAHPILGAALCVTDAWGTDELASRISEAGLQLDGWWDRSAAILDLIDRAEARIGLATVAARDLGISLASLGGLSSFPALFGLTGDDARRMADEVRDAVRSGELGYFAALVRRPIEPD